MQSSMSQETRSYDQEVKADKETLATAFSDVDEDLEKNEVVESSASQSIWITLFEAAKYTYSLVLLVFSIIVIMAAICEEQTNGFENNLPGGVAIPLFWFCIVWLAMIEGGQGALVGLQPTPKDQYAQSHPIALKCTKLAHDGDNMERFIVGRQFLVVIIIFTINMCGGAIADANVMNLNSPTTSIFLSNGVAMILTTVNLGQLTAQVNAADCMLDFINNRFMLFSTYFSLGIEFSGLLHGVYLVQYLFSALTGKPIETKEEPRNATQNVFYWGRVLMSMAILGFALAVTIDALFKGWTTMWDGIPPVASIFIVIALLGFVGIMEGMQIAAFAVVKLDEASYKDTHKIAHANCKLLFKGTNLGRFLIGRQLCVCACMFIAARCFTIDKEHPEIFAGDTSFEASPGFQDFINTGLLGAVVTTMIGCLIWRIIASSYPLAFLSNPIIFLTIKLCLALEATGICSASWALGKVHRKIANFQPDEFYLDRNNELEMAEDKV